MSHTSAAAATELRRRFAETEGGEPGLLAAVAEALATLSGDHLDRERTAALEDALVDELQRLRGRRDRDPLGLVLTPATVAEALGELMREEFPAQTAAVQWLLDPAAGSGRLLDGVVAGGVPATRRLGWDVDPVVLTLGRALASSRARFTPLADLELTEVDGLAAARPDAPRGALAVVCNPPFVAAYSRRSQAAAMDVARLEVVARGWSSGRVNTAIAFVARVVRDLLRPGELAGFVLPDAFLSSPRYRVFRRALLAHVDALTIGRLPEGAFAGRSLRAVLLACRRAERTALEADPLEPHLDRIVFRTRSDRWGEATTLSVAAVIANDAAIIPWPTAWSARAFALVAQGHRLDARFGVADGINPGGAEARAALVSASSRGMIRPRPLVEGRQVHAGHVAPAEAWVETDPGVVRPEWRRGGTSLRRPGLFDGPRLYSRQTAARLVCAYTDDGSMALNSVHVIRWRGRRADAPTQLMRLSAVLCTEAATELYQALYAEDRAAFPQVKVANLAALPLPWPPPRDLAEAADRWAQAPSASRLRLVDELTRRWLSDEAGSGLHDLE